MVVYLRLCHKSIHIIGWNISSVHVYSYRICISNRRRFYKISVILIHIIFLFYKKNKDTLECWYLFSNIPGCFWESADSLTFLFIAADIVSIIGSDSPFMSKYLFNFKKSTWRSVCLLLFIIIIQSISNMSIIITVFWCLL